MLFMRKSISCHCRTRELFSKDIRTPNHSFIVDGSIDFVEGLVNQIILITAFDPINSWSCYRGYGINIQP